MSPIRQRLIGVLLAVSIAAAVVPSASAAPVEQFLPNAGDQPRQAAQAGLVAPSSKAPAATTISSDDGFDWGDAGVGAGVAIALGMVGAGGALVLRGRRGPTARPTSI